jgi:putative transposase
MYGRGINSLLLTFVDIYIRMGQILMLLSNVRKGDFFLMLTLMKLEYKLGGMSFRNDNDSQFNGTTVHEYLKEKGILQEFSHVATPKCLYRSAAL